jgi:DNA-binding response OmpR family regulator
MNILIIEDDLRLSLSIRDSFKEYKFSNRIDILNSYADFLTHSVSISSYDIILIDINLWSKQRKAGLQILEHLRKTHKNIPIIIISGHCEYSFIEQAFHMGAHDYISKPFRNRELKIRIERWFRNYVFSEYYCINKTLSYSGIDYDLSKYEFYFWGKKIKLSKGSKYLFSLFFIHRSELLRQEFLIEKIWGFGEREYERNLRIKIMRLKKQLQVYWLDVYLRTERWEGYIFEKKAD